MRVYHINVAYQGRHLFRTQEQCLTKADYADLKMIFMERFPKEDGFTVSGYFTEPVFYEA